MDYEDRRACERLYDGDSYETFLGLRLDNAIYRLHPLDTSAGGMGMLVRNDCPEVLRTVKIGSFIQMKYRTPEEDFYMSFEIRHITPLITGPFKGHFHVGLAL